MSDDESDGSEEFPDQLASARELLDAEDLTAFNVGVVRDGESVQTTSSYRTDDVEAEEGTQALTLLATHVRVVADQAGVDYLTAARDAAALADRVEETD
ncbi:MAG: hypothetical protein ABEJ61_08610 [Haloferacaceae archaeon]